MPKRFVNDKNASVSTVETFISESGLYVGLMITVFNFPISVVIVAFYPLLTKCFK